MPLIMKITKRREMTSTVVLICSLKILSLILHNLQNIELIL
jgi:hypothetical protein